MAVLLPVALTFLDILSDIQSLSLLLLLVGLWSAVFGLALSERKDRLYYSGWGIVVALASTFYVLPLSYTAGLIILAVVGIVVVTAATRDRKGAAHTPPAEAAGSSV